MTLTIGITDTESRFSNYPIWIKGDDKDIAVIKLSPENSADLKKCDGIVLSGGLDTHPDYYNNKRIDYPLAPNEFNRIRDEFELDVFKYACEKNIPVLAICRGMQLVNIALGGDLIQDIEEHGKLDHRRHGDTDGMHEIRVIKDSLLYEITGAESGSINSAHHQAVGKIANDLIVTACSPDGIAEGAEWKDENNKQFLLCVQWHPERLAQQQKDNPFTYSIRKHFLNAVKNNA